MDARQRREGHGRMVAGHGNGVNRGPIPLSEEMHEALARRRISERGTEQFQRADERVACVLELFGEMQRRGAVPDEVWRLPLRPPA